MKKFLQTLLVTVICCAGIFAEDARVTAEDVYKSHQNSVKEFFTGKLSYIEIDDVKIRTTTVFDNLKASDSVVIYNPENQQTGVRTYFETMFYNILFEEQAREIIAKGYECYVKDFNEKNLDRRKGIGKTTKMYGEGKTYVEFGTFKNMMNHYANTTFLVGYRFHKKTPYFVVSVMEAKDEWAKGEDEVRWVVPTITLYFTLAQGKSFLQNIDSDVLNVFQKEYDAFKNADINEEREELKKYETEDLDTY